MTLKVDIGIDPYGSAEDHYPIFRLKISNEELIEDKGFGHEICRYNVRLLRHNNQTMRTVLSTKEWEIEKECEVIHDRRDGALSLVRLAIEKIEGRE